jgi:hypothetical protein
LFLIAWLAFALFFFFVWEAGILCRHCPHWAGPGKILRCHANYGVIKIWKHDPGPMSALEKVQFLIGASAMVAAPIVRLIIAESFVIAAIAGAAAVFFSSVLSISICTKCVNFSCPLNRVPKRAVDEYLTRNPTMLRAWETSGYEPSDDELQ